MIRPRFSTARVPVRRTGMTLMEVMLSLTIMLIALAAIGQLVNMGSDHGLQARMNARGGRLAQAKMAEIEGGVYPISGGGSGTFDGDDSDWSWTVDPQAQSPPNLYLVTITVSHAYRGSPFTITLSQMLFDPTMMGSASQAEQPSTNDVTAATATSGTGGTGGINGTTGGSSP